MSAIRMLVKEALTRDWVEVRVLTRYCATHVRTPVSQDEVVAALEQLARERVAIQTRVAGYPEPMWRRR
jgi:hypothetical protein